MKKTLIIFLVCIIALGVFANTVFANESILDKVKGNTINSGVVDEVDRAASNIIEIARGVGIVVMFIFVVWAGWIMLFSPSGQKLQSAKGQLAGGLFFLFFVYQTEAIVGTLLSLIGYQVK
jgi:hypothetical protein